MNEVALSGSPGKRADVLGIGLLLSLPLLLLAVNNAWIFTSTDNIDPWIYHGYFRECHCFSSEFYPKAYYEDRLAWILPGFLAYRFFTPLISNFVLHLGFYYTAVFSFYYVLKNTFDRRTALLAAVFFGADVYFLKSIGWDYVDGAGVTYYLLTLAFLTLAAKKDRGIWSVIAAGMAASSMICAYPVWVVFTPPLFIYFWLAKSHFRKRPVLMGEIWKPVALFFLGLFLQTLFFSLLAYRLKGKFHFYVNSICMARRWMFVQNPWRTESSDWVWSARWLVMPLIVWGGAFANLISRWRQIWRREWDLTLFHLINFGVYGVIFLIWELSGGVVLQQPYVTAMLLPTVYFAMGALLLRVPKETRPFPYAFGLLTVIALFCLALSPSWQDRLRPYLFFGRFECFDIAAVLFLGFAVILLKWRSSNKRMVFLSSALGLSLAAMLLGSSFLPRQNGPERFLNVDSAMELVNRKMLGRSLKPFFWYHEKEEPFSAEFRSIASTYTWGPSILTLGFPSLENAKRGLPKPGQLVVVLSAQQDAARQAIVSLGAAGVESRLLERKVICYNAGCYSMSLIEAVGRDLKKTH